MASTYADASACPKLNSAGCVQLRGCQDECLAAERSALPSKGRICHGVNYRHPLLFISWRFTLSFRRRENPPWMTQQPPLFDPPAHLWALVRWCLPNKWTISISSTSVLCILPYYFLFLYSSSALFVGLLWTRLEGSRHTGRFFWIELKISAFRKDLFASAAGVALGIRGFRLPKDNIYHHDCWT